MIRTDAEYQDALKRLQQDRTVVATQRAKLHELDLTDEEIERALQPGLSFHEQLQEEVSVYEAMRRGEISSIHSLVEIGRVIIGLRIARGITQRELAERMQVSESQVSRDERNDYHGITVDRAQRIISALNGRIQLDAEAPMDDGDLVTA